MSDNQGIDPDSHLVVKDWEEIWEDKRSVTHYNGHKKDKANGMIKKDSLRLKMSH